MNATHERLDYGWSSVAKTQLLRATPSLLADANGSGVS